MVEKDSNYKNDVFVPTVAEFPDDVLTSWEIQKPLAQAGYRPGLMLFVRSAEEGKPRVADPDNVGRQYENLHKFGQVYGNAPIITMLPNMPIGDIDFLHNSSFARDHVLSGIEFAKGLPLGGRRILTFHLNSLGPVREFKSKDRESWYGEFQSRVQSFLEEIAAAAVASNVDVLVETLCTPEFGDMEAGEGQAYNGAPDLRSLRSPFYIFTGNGIQERIRGAGLGICLDLCHNRTIYHAAEDGEEDVLFYKDIRRVREEELTLLDDVYALNSQTDLVHLNDGAGRYTCEGGVFEEGVRLGGGDITALPKIIGHLNSHRIPFVLEINEEDFKGRPNTRASIEYLLNLSE